MMIVRSYLVGAGLVLVGMVAGALFVLGLVLARSTGPTAVTPLPVGWSAAAPGHVELVTYTDPYGSTAPGGAPAPDTSAAGVAGSQVGSAVDGLSSVPFALLGGVIGLLILWWVVTFVFGLFR